jgi:hypothetical protein
MHSDGLDGLHELVRDAARPHWDRGDLSAACAAAGAAVSAALPGDPVWFVDPDAPGAGAVQDGVERLLGALDRLATAPAPGAEHELLSALSLAARYVETAVRVDTVEALVASAQALRAPTPRAADELLAAVAPAAWPLVAGRLAEELSDGEAAPGARALYLRITERDDPSARAAARRCTERLRDAHRRRSTLAALTPDVLDWLDPEDRALVPSLLATELQDGWLEGERVVRGTAAAQAAPLLWDDFLPGARAHVIEAIGFGLQNGEPERQAYLARVVCTIAPLLAGRESSDLARGLARALVRRNAVDVADQIVAADLPAAFRDQLVRAIAVQQPVGPVDAANAVCTALGAPLARAS